jgi:hypothetical protein
VCEGCGVYLGAEDFDVPMLCADCAKERSAAGHTVLHFDNSGYIDCGPRLQTPKKPDKKRK